ncbi:MAG: oligoendopeptidase, partial [Alphaproteobacteria bacterium]|nr:oligoendopeptidase [Alphaproteobacteria bacterium]
VLRNLKTQIDLFRPENIPLDTQQEQLGAEYMKIRGAMTVTLDGEEMTLQKASDRLYWLDRAKREEAWLASQERQHQDHARLDDIFSQLVGIRKEIAANAGFDNYRDFKFKSLGRYDYTPEDCYTFHEAIEQAIVPLVAELQKEQAAGLGLEKLRPWDGAVDPKGRPPLKAFNDTDDLVQKSLQVFTNLDPLFHDTVKLLRDKGQLDLESRMNKAPGGYMSPLSESKIPFIFANATEKVGDLVTLIHEVGHAVHSVQTRDLRLLAYGSNPSETAELASMSMELLTMDQWDVFFPIEEECRRAKRDHLEKIIGFFPWMAMVDAFQHEIYLKPDLTIQDRHKIWAWTQQRFTTGLVDWSGFADWHETQWHKQLHIFEVPFYYIEYGIAQLGALQVWRNYKQDKKQAVEQYKNALALGYTESIPEIYETAGIRFDFSAGMLKELMAFVQDELKALS